MNTINQEVDDTFNPPENVRMVSSALTRKSQTYQKFTVLFFAIWILIPAFYCFDQPVAIFEQLKEHFVAEDNPFDVYFVALYIIYAVGNAFLPVFTGGMRDCNGDRIVLGSLAIIMMVGQLLFCWGVNEKWVSLMILGRVFLGWGVESTLPILVSYLAPYFRSHISIVLSLLQLFLQIGLVSSIYVTPIILAEYTLNIALLSGVVLIFVGLILLLASFLIDQGVEEQYAIHPNYLGNTSDIILNESQHVGQTQMYWFKFQDFTTYPNMFWLLLAFNSLLYCSIVTVVNVSQYVIASILFSTNNQFTSLDIALFWMLGCTTLPLIGVFVHYFKKRRYLLVASVLIVIEGHLQYVITPHFGLIVLAIGFSLAYVCTWSSIVHIIKWQAFGKAFGIIVCFQNISFVFMPFVLDIVNRKYLGTAQFLIALSLIALILAVCILVEDMSAYFMLDKYMMAIHKPTPRRISNVSFDDQNNEYDDFAAQARNQ